MVSIALSLICVLNVAAAENGLIRENDCRRQGNVLTCKKSIPKVVPMGVSNVRITNNSIPMSGNTFRHSSWTTVKVLNLADKTSGQ